MAHFFSFSASVEQITFPRQVSLDCLASSVIKKRIRICLRKKEKLPSVDDDVKTTKDDDDDLVSHFLPFADAYSTSKLDFSFV